MVARVCLGRNAAGEVGLRVSRPGVDAVSPAQDVPENFIIDSRWTPRTIERIAAAGIYHGYYQLTNSNGVLQGFGPTIPHGLPYTPIITVAEWHGQGVLSYDHWIKFNHANSGTPSYANRFRVVTSGSGYYLQRGAPVGGGYSRGVEDSAYLPSSFAYIFWKAPGW